MPLKLGEWKMNDSGVEKRLFLDSVDAAGVIIGKIEATTLTGFWDETSQTIAFALQLGGQPTPLGFIKEFSLVRQIAHNLDKMFYGR